MAGFADEIRAIAAGTNAEKIMIEAIMPCLMFFILIILIQLGLQ